MTSSLARRILFYLSFILLAVVCQQSALDESLLLNNKEEEIHLSFNTSSSSRSNSSSSSGSGSGNNSMLSGVLTSLAMVHPSAVRRKRNGSSSSSSSRTRRDIFHLYNMMSCTTQCDPLSYKGYGCYCGFLGSGLTVDAIDRCCKKHDFCYGATPCRHQSLIYFVPYKWKCNGGHPYCDKPTCVLCRDYNLIRCCMIHDRCYDRSPCLHNFLVYFVRYRWLCHQHRPRCVTQYGEMKASDYCAHHLCECDRQFAECIRQYPCPTKHNKPGCPSNPLRSLG